MSVPTLLRVLVCTLVVAAAVVGMSANGALQTANSQTASLLYIMESHDLAGELKGTMQSASWPTS
jgi:hypothetical protein